MAGLYSGTDIVGSLLCHWRTKVVLPLITGSHIDLACGDNRLVRALGTGVGVDIQNYGHADLVTSNFAHLPFANASIDTVTVLASLNYIPNALEVLHEIKRILRTDGRLIITLPNQRIMRYWLQCRRQRPHRLSLADNDLGNMFDVTDFKLLDKRYFMMGLNRLYVAASRLHGRPGSAGSSG